jgi:hypothetical protein
MRINPPSQSTSHHESMSSVAGHILGALFRRRSAIDNFIVMNLTNVTIVRLIRGADLTCGFLCNCSNTIGEIRRIAVACPFFGETTMNVILLSLLLAAETSGQVPPVPEPIPLPQPMRMAPAPTTSTIVPLAPPILTVEQFAASFVPIPGVHQSTIIHPATKKPIDVVFRLPELPLRKTYYSKNRLTFDFGRTQVVLIFRLIGGKVDVRYG